jgi:hypothetical protein
MWAHGQTAGNENSGDGETARDGRDTRRHASKRDECYLAAAWHETISAYCHDLEREGASKLVSTASCGRLRDGATCCVCVRARARACAHACQSMKVHGVELCARQCVCFVAYLFTTPRRMKLTCALERER